MYQQNLKWRLMPDKMAGKLVTSHIASVLNQGYWKHLVFPNDVVHYGVTSIPVFLSGIGRHLNRSVYTKIIISIKVIGHLLMSCCRSCSKWSCASCSCFSLISFSRSNMLPPPATRDRVLARSAAQTCYPHLQPEIQYWLVQPLKHVTPTCNQR